MVKKFETSFGKVSYQDSGSGKVIVLVHGFCENKSIWKSLTAELKSHYRVIAFDALGFGGSVPSADFDYSMRDQAAAFLEVLKHEKIRSTFWIGHSMGGYMSLEALAQSPGKVRGICLFHSSAAADTDEKKLNRNKTIRVIEKTPDVFIREFYYNLFAPANKELFSSEIDELKSQLRKVKPEALTGTLAGMRDRENHEKTLKQASIPKYYLLGEHDQVIPVDAALKQAKKVGAEFNLLLESGHMGYIEEPEVSTAAIRAFLEEHWKA